MTVSEQLRQAREARHLTIAQVAETTKLRGDQIRALEEGRFEVFSAPVYARGFVRTYATLLKLDVVPLMKALDAELGGVTRFFDPPLAGAKPGGLVDRLMLQFTKVDWRKSAIGLSIATLMVLSVVGYFLWRHYRARDPLSRIKPAVYQPAKTNTGETLPLPSPGTGKK